MKKVFFIFYVFCSLLLCTQAYAIGTHLSTVEVLETGTVRNHTVWGLKQEVGDTAAGFLDNLSSSDTARAYMVVRLPAIGSDYASITKFVPSGVLTPYDLPLFNSYSDSNGFMFYRATTKADWDTLSLEEKFETLRTGASLCGSANDRYYPGTITRDCYANVNMMHMFMYGGDYVFAMVEDPESSDTDFFGDDTSAVYLTNFGFAAEYTPAPTTINASDGTLANKVTINWNPVVHADTYKLYRCTSTSNSSCGSPISTQPATSGQTYDDTSAAVGLTYYYRVQACLEGYCSVLSAYDAGYKTPKYNLSVNSSGVTSVTISSNNGYGGTTNYTKSSISKDTNVNLTATTVNGYTFTGWSGDCSYKSGTTCNVFMNANKTVTANYTVNAPSDYGLSVIAVGDGTVTGNGIACGIYGIDCFQQYPDGTNITLTAEPSIQVVFTGWSGGCASTNGTSCEVHMTQDRSVTANFIKTNYLGVEKNEGGSVVSDLPGIDCGVVCGEYYKENLSVELTALPSEGYVFSHWSDACNHNSTKCLLSMDAPRLAVATFLPVVGQAKWNFTPQTPSPSYFDSPGIAENGVIYTTAEGVLYALNRDGSLKWGKQYEGGVRGEPAILSDGTLVIGTSSLDRYHAINPDGSLKWTFLSPVTLYNTHADHKPSIGPDDTVYVSDGFGSVYALNPGDGSTKWKYKTDGLVSGIAVASDNTVYAGVWSSNSNYFYAINPDSTLKWTYPVGADVVAPIAIDIDGTVYFGAHDSYFYALNPDGTRKWRYPTGDWINSAPAISGDGTIYVSSYDSHLYAITRNGDLKWRYPLVRATMSSPAIDSNGTVYVTSEDGLNTSDDGYIYAVNPDGSLLWSEYVASSFGSSPIIDIDGTVYVAAKDAFYAISTTSNGPELSPWPMLGKNSRNSSYQDVSLQDTFSLNVAKDGNGSGSITSLPTGVSCGADCSESYLVDTQVVLTASASPGSSFIGWSDACVGTENICEVQMYANKNVSATFALQPQYDLFVSKTGNGQGTVTSSPAGISCGEDCTNTYSSGASITLTASASAGSKFAGWSGACTGASSTCTVSMAAAKSVTAIFNQIETFNLLVSKDGTGSGTVTSNPTGVSCGTDCQQSYNSGTNVALVATPLAGSEFAGWGGACSGTATTCNVSMASVQNVTATFNEKAIPPSYSLSVSKDGSGIGTITSSPAGISCGSDCYEEFAGGTSVTLIAAASSGFRFDGWSGACNGTSLSCQVTVSNAKSAVASFSKIIVIPTVPSGLVASDGTYSDRIYLTWNAQIGATSYNVYRADSTAGAKTLAGSTVSPAFSDYAASSNTFYYYWVTARNSAGESSFSAYDVGSLQGTSSDTTPDAFTYFDQNNAELNAVTQSNLITVTGINASAPISIVGGSYSIDGTQYTSGSGSVNNGQTVQLRLTSASSYETTTSATLTIGGVSDTFSVTTKASAVDTTPDAFTFFDQNNAELDTVTPSNLITVTGINALAPISIVGGSYSVDGTQYTSGAGTVSNGQTVRVRLTSASSYETTKSATLSIGGMSDTFSVTTKATTADTTPDAFTFFDQNNAELNTITPSNLITVTGINAPAPISIVGGSYSVDGTQYTSGAGTVNNGQTVRVRLTSASSYETTKSTTLTIGGVSEPFSVTTKAATADTTPDAFTFFDQNNAELNTVTPSNAITVSGIDAPAPISIVGGSYSIDGMQYTSVAGTVTNGQTVRVRLTSSDSYSTKLSTTLTIGGVSEPFGVTTKADPSPGAVKLYEAFTAQLGTLSQTAFAVSDRTAFYDDNTYLSTGLQSLQGIGANIPGTNSDSYTLNPDGTGTVNHGATVYDSFANDSNFVLSSLRSTADLRVAVGVQAPVTPLNPASISGDFFVSRINIGNYVSTTQFGTLTLDGSGTFELNTIDLAGGSPGSTYMTGDYTISADGQFNFIDVTGGVSQAGDAFVGAGVSDVNYQSLWFGVKRGGQYSPANLPGKYVMATFGFDGVVYPELSEMFFDGSGGVTVSTQTNAAYNNSILGSGNGIYVLNTDGTFTYTLSGETVNCAIGEGFESFVCAYINDPNRQFISFAVRDSSVDIVPDAFTFFDQNNAELNTVTPSNLITVSGIDAPAPISIVGGSYSIDGTQYTSGSGTVSNGQTVRVRLTSSDSYSTKLSTTLTIGGVSDTFSVTTKAAAVDTTPDAFTFFDQNNAELNTVTPSNAITVSGIDAPAAISIVGGSYSIDGMQYTSAAGTVTNGQTVRVRLTTSGDYATSREATLTIGGVSDTFSVVTLADPGASTGQVLFYEGFEGYAIGRLDQYWVHQWSNAGSIEVVASPVSQGGQSLKARGFSGSCKGVSAPGTVFATDVTVNFDFYLPGGDAVGQVPATLHYAGLRVFFFAEADGTYRADVGGAGLAELHGIDAGSWHAMQLLVDRDNSRAAFLIDGILGGVFDVSLNESGGWGSDISIYANNNSSGNTIYVDEIKVLAADYSFLKVKNDFNADNVADLLYQNYDDGRLLIWTMQNFTRTVNFPQSLAAGWAVAGTGDFNGDGTSDVLYVKDDGTTAIAEMSNATRLNLAFPGGANTLWSVQGVGDFNGDGTDDILWRRSTDGITMVWGIRGAARTTVTYPGGLASFWDIVGVGDFDADGIDDILCQHNSDGRLLIWKMNNYGRAAIKLPQSLANTWTVVGVGDFNADGTDDVLYRKDTGDTAVAEFANLNRSAVKFPGGIGLPWSVKDVGDYNGDGHDDIFFRRASDGVTLAWGIVNSARTNVAWPGGLATQWVVQ